MKKKKNAKGSLKVVKKLVPLAGLAMKNGFCLEASLILSSIMESRLRSVIRRVEKEMPKPGLNLEKCIRKLKYLRSHNPGPLLERNFDPSILESLRNWKNRRNAILNTLTKSHVSGKRVEKLADEGVFLLQDLSRSCKKFKSEWKNSHQPVPGNASRNDS